MGESYLTDRAQKVDIDNTYIDDVISECIKFIFGIIQTQVFGLMLFTLHVASLGGISYRHGILSHDYAEDQQKFLDFRPIYEGDQEKGMDRLNQCFR